MSIVSCRPLGVTVPETYYDGSKDGFLLLEDIGDVPLREAAQGLPLHDIDDLYRKAIDQLVLLQVEGTASRRRIVHRLSASV